MPATIQVILQHDVDKVGKSGELVKVRPGFARNFLLPRPLAVPATTAAVNRITHEKAVALAKAEKLRRSARARGENLRPRHQDRARAVGEDASSSARSRRRRSRTPSRRRVSSSTARRCTSPEPIKALGYVRDPGEALDGRDGDAQGRSREEVVRLFEVRKGAGPRRPFSISAVFHDKRPVRHVGRCLTGPVTPDFYVEGPVVLVGSPVFYVGSPVFYVEGPVVRVGSPVFYVERPDGLVGSPDVSRRASRRACRESRLLCRGSRRACRESRRLCRASRRLCRASRRLCRASRRACRASRRLCRASRRACRASRRLCRASRRACRASRPTSSVPTGLSGVPTSMSGADPSNPLKLLNFPPLPPGPLRAAPPHPGPSLRNPRPNPLQYRLLPRLDGDSCARPRPASRRTRGMSDSIARSSASGDSPRAAATARSTFPRNAGSLRPSFGRASFPRSRGKRYGASVSIMRRSWGMRRTSSRRCVPRRSSQIHPVTPMWRSSAR